MSGKGKVCFLGALINLIKNEVLGGSKIQQTLY